MANTTQVYRRESADRTETVTIMSYLGADSGDRDEIRRIVEQNGTVLEDGIAYLGTSGQHWLAEQHANYVADGFQPDDGNQATK